MVTAGKPETGVWPDSLKLDVMGVSVLIEYKNDAVIVPCKFKGMALGWGIAKYLLEEGFIKPPDYINDAIQKKQQ